MLPSLIAGALFAVFGWIRASRLGGDRADKAQYAAAYGIPALLMTLIVMTVAARAGWLG